MYLKIVIDPLSLGICHLAQPLDLASRLSWAVCLQMPRAGRPRQFVNKGFLDLRVVSDDNSRANGIDPLSKSYMFKLYICIYSIIPNSFQVTGVQKEHQGLRTSYFFQCPITRATTHIGSSCAVAATSFWITCPGQSEAVPNSQPEPITPLFKALSSTWCRSGYMFNQWPCSLFYSPAFSEQCVNYIE